MTLDEMQVIAFILNWGGHGYVDDDDDEDDFVSADDDDDDEIEAQAFTATGLTVREERTAGERREELAKAFCCLASRPLDRTALRVFAEFTDLETLSDLFVVIWEEPEPEDGPIARFVYQIIDNLADYGWLSPSEEADIRALEADINNRQWQKGEEPVHAFHFARAAMFVKKLQIMAQAYLRNHNDHG